jgi:predicted Fe-Mo cluster-binding NifX family protein
MTDKGLESEVSGHFGQAPFFFVVDLKDKGERRVVRDGDIHELVNTYSAVRNLREHACASVVELLMSNNVDALVVEGIGGRPFMLLQQKGVKMFTGAFGNIKEVLRDFLNGMLQELQSSSCGQHDHAH